MKIIKGSYKYFFFTAPKTNTMTPFIILLLLLLGSPSYSGIMGKGLMCNLTSKPRQPNYSDIIVYFNSDGQVVLNRIYREIDTFLFMQNPEITSKLDADANEVRWVCTTGCPSEVYGNFVLNRKTLELSSAAESFKCTVIYSSKELKERFDLRVQELQKEYNAALEGNKI